MEVWGITGLSGSGKSTLSRHFASLGYPTLDADRVGSLVVDRNTEAGKEGFEKIYKFFGASVLNSLGQLDKRAMMKRLMSNPSEKESLEAILDPLVLRHIEREGTRWKERGAKFAFVEGSRLAESGFHRVAKGILLVETDFTKRVNRIAKRDSMGKLEVEALFAMQDDDLMKRVATQRWKNDGSEAALKKLADAWLSERLTKAKSPGA